jgi:hypothetical protein
MRLAWYAVRTLQGSWARRRMATALVIEHFDVVEQLALGITVTAEVSPTSFLSVEKKASITELS